MRRLLAGLRPQRTRVRCGDHRCYATIGCSESIAPLAQIIRRTFDRRQHAWRCKGSNYSRGSRGYFGGRELVSCSPKETGGPMFDSPFEYCAVCRAYVVLDQTQRQCAREHSCAAVPKCPLQRFFTGTEFREGQGGEGEGSARASHRNNSK